MKIRFNTILISLLVCSFTLLTGCQNTVDGFGKDMQNTGKEIQKSANN